MLGILAFVMNVAKKDYVCVCVCVHFGCGTI